MLKHHQHQHHQYQHHQQQRLPSSSESCHGVCCRRRCGEASSQVDLVNLALMWIFTIIIIYLIIINKNVIIMIMMIIITMVRLPVRWILSTWLSHSHVNIHNHHHQFIILNIMNMIVMITSKVTIINTYHYAEASSLSHSHVSLDILSLKYLPFLRLLQP